MSRLMLATALVGLALSGCAGNGAQNDGEDISLEAESDGKADSIGSRLIHVDNMHEHEANPGASGRVSGGGKTATEITFFADRALTPPMGLDGKTAALVEVKSAPDNPSGSSFGQLLYILGHDQAGTYRFTAPIHCPGRNVFSKQAVIDLVDRTIQDAGSDNQTYSLTSCGVPDEVFDAIQTKPIPVSDRYWGFTNAYFWDVQIELD